MVKGNLMRRRKVSTSWLSPAPPIDKFLQIAAEGLREAFFDFCQQTVVDEWQVHEQLHQGFVEQWEYLVLDDFFDNQRHGDNHLGLNFGEGIHDDFWRGCTGEERHVAAFDEAMEHFHHKAVHVCQWQHTDEFVAGFEERQAVDIELHIRPKVTVAEHYAFGEAGRA